MSNKGDQRRISGNLSLTYDVSFRPSPRDFPTHSSSSWYHMQRPQPFTEHAAPGPSVPYTYYDRYGPEEPPAPAFREEYPPNEFNNNFWRPPDREFFPQGTQSPERFRPPQVDAWQRPPAWNESEVAPWSDRREPVQKPYTPPQWNRVPRDNPATRMFEPSDNWKQTHGERAHGRDHYSPSQPVAERYRPYSPPANANRNRFPHFNPRSDQYRPLFNDADPWVPDEGEPYESIARDHRAAISTRSITPDHMDRRNWGVDGEERLVSPVSPRSAQQASPGYGLAAAEPKRESPELPHLEAFYRKPAPPVRVPPGPKLHSRSPSYSSTSSSVNPSHVQAQVPVKAGLPPKPQFQAPLRPPILGGAQIPARLQTRSPPLQISPITRTTPEPDSISCTLRVEQARSTDAATTTQQKLIEVCANPNSNGRNNAARRSLFHNAPSFVPSTLAIDAALMYPARDDSSETPPTATQSARDDDVANSDMDVSLPPTPVCMSLPAAELVSNRASKADPNHEEAETDSIRSSRSPSRPTDSTCDTIHDPKDAGAYEEDAADESDMDMSPPPSPAMKSVSALGGKAIRAADSPKLELSRPILAIDTSIASPQLRHEVARQSSSASPVPTTPEHVVEEIGGDESDMDMSSPTSEIAPSLPHTQRSPSPLSSAGQLPIPTLVSESPSISKDTHAVTSRSEHARSEAVDTPPPPSPFVERTAANTPDSQLPTPAVPASREVSVQVSPRLTAVAKLARPHVEVGELSPPASDKTLQGDAEMVDKDHDAAVQIHKEDAALPQKIAMDVDQPHSDRVYTEIPLSDALRMVAKLRFRHDPVTQNARVEPILISNRQLAEPEEPAAPAPVVTPAPILTTETDTEQPRSIDGHYDGTKHSLRKRFAQHQAALAHKVARLRKEYLALHERWLVHCAKLDDIARASALEEAAATACRTTRRTTAMGDAVRSDLEMEQILASLGNEELTDANHLSAKNAAVIPDMVSVTKGRVEYIYDDTNNFVEDPREFYKLETGIDDWSEEEKAIFVEKYAVHPKQFGIIADFLPNKTPAQCVTFYYLHKNTTIDFRKVIAQYNTIGKRRRSGRGKQKGNALLADILKHDDEVGRDGTTSSGRRKRGAPISSSTPIPPSTSAEWVDQPKKATTSASRRGTAQNTPDPTPTPDPEPAPAPATKRPRRRANPSAKAVAAMEQDPPVEAQEEDARPAKRTRKARKSKAEVDDTDDAPSTPADTKPAEQPEPAVRKRIPGSGSSWSAEDKALFLKLLGQYGDDFKRIASSMPNKTTMQVSAFHRANLTEMQLAKVAALAPKRSPTPQESTRRTTIISGSADITLVKKTSTSGVEHGAATMSVSRSRSSGRMSPPPNPSGTQSSETDKRPISAAPHDSAASSKAGLPPRPLQYQGGLAAAFAGPSRSAISTRLPPRAGQLPPLTMTFPSTVAYSNLSPSSFSGDPQSVSSRINPARLPGATSPTIMMEFSDFAPQPWQVAAALTRPGQMHPSVIVGNGATADLPATLETTEDLVRYLEHRTRLTAGQTNDIDFM